MNLLEELQNPEKRTAAEILAPLYKRKLPEEVKGRGYELFEEAEMPEWLKKTLGLATEIATDPLTWLSFGGTTVAGRAALRAGKSLSQLSRLEKARKGFISAVGLALPGKKGVIPIIKGVPYFKAEAKVLEKLSPILKAFSKAKHPLYEAAREAASKAAGEVSQKMLKVAREFGEQAEELKKAGLLPEHIMRIVEQAKRGPELVQEIRKFIPKGIKISDDALIQFANKYDEMVKIREAAFDAADYLFSRLPVEEAEGMAKQWVHHIATKLGQKYFKQMAHYAAKGDWTGAPKGLREFAEYITRWAQGPEGAIKSVLGVRKPPMPTGAARRIYPLSYTQLFRRVARGEGIAEINRVAQQLGLGKVFTEDLREIARTVIADTAKIVKKSAFIKHVLQGAEQVGLGTTDAAEAAARGWKTIDQIAPDLARLFKGKTKALIKSVYFDPEHAKEILGLVYRMTSPKEIKAFLKYYDKALGIWKAWTLGPFIPYHVRNDFTDILWFNWLAGIDTRNLVDAARILKKLAAQYDVYPKPIAELITKAPATPWSPFSGVAQLVGKAKAAIKPLKPIDDDAIIRELFDIDFFKRGFHAGETTELTRGALGKLTGAPQRFLRKTMEFGQVREDWARIAHYIARRREGWNPMEAFRDVIKYHYNYGIDGPGALSDFERAIPNRIFFFYRWFRNNIPGSIRNLLEHFGKHVGAAKVLRTIESSVPGYDRYMPEWMRERGPIKVLKGKKGTEYFLTQAWWPFVELTELTRPGKAFIERLAPLIRIPMEVATGREFYYDRPLVRYPGERRELLGVRLPSRLEYLLRQWRGVGEARRIHRRATEPGVPTGERVRNVIAALLAGARTYGYEPQREAQYRLFETIEKMGIIRSAMERAEREGDYREAMRLKRLLDELSRRQAEYKLVAGT